MIRIALLATSVLLAPSSRALAPAAPPAPPGMPPRQQGARMTPDSVQVRVIELATSPVGARRYRLVVPAGDRRTPRPLLLVLHGCTQDAADFARGSRLDRAATERGWIVAYAEQPPAANPRRCWNWFLPAHQQRDAGEPALIEAIR
nr:PHB depolymerase family esterase [Gemmatimonadaceae bacterium]